MSCCSAELLSVITNFRLATTNDTKFVLQCIGLLVAPISINIFLFFPKWVSIAQHAKSDSGTDPHAHTHRDDGCDRHLYGAYQPAAIDVHQYPASARDRHPQAHTDACPTHHLSVALHKKEPGIEH